MLRRELAVEPLPETKELASLIELGAAPRPAPKPSSARGLPLRVLRPPLLVGREREWERMEAAWEQGQFIILAGEAGVGKTRLALDFAASKGEWLFLEGRPGDVVAPLATSIRNFRRIFEHKPDLKLEPWVRRALAQVLPELGESGSGSAAQGSAHLLEAVVQLMKSELEVSTFVYDDLHFADPVSIEAGFYVISSPFPMGRPGSVPHWIACLRPNELAERSRSIYQQLVAAGQAAWIEVEPLDEEATAALLESLDLEALGQGHSPALADRLYRRTGGNMLFILETLRNLLETERLGEGVPERLPLTDKVGGVVRQRLARLSAGDRARAAPFLLEAAHRARQAFLFKEADGLYTQAFELFDVHGDADHAFEALFRRAMLLLNTDASEETRRVTGQPLERALTPQQLTQAHEARARILHLLGEHDEAERMAQAGVAYAVEAGDAKSEGGNLEIVGLSQLYRARQDEALKTFERMDAIYRALGHPIGLATAQMGLGSAHRLSDRALAHSHFEAAERQFAVARYVHQQASALIHLGQVQLELGEAKTALTTLLRAQEVLGNVEGEVFRNIMLASALSRCFFELGDYAQALALLETGLAVREGKRYGGVINLLLARAHFERFMGCPEAAARTLQEALSWPTPPKQFRFGLLLTQAVSGANALFAEARREALERGDTYGLARLELERAAFLEPEAVLPATQKALELSVQHGLKGLRTAALVRAAQSLLELGRNEDALEQSAQAVQSATPNLVTTRGELLFTHARALEASGKDDARRFFGEAAHWLEDTVQTRVPSAYRQSFLEGNPVNRAIGEVVRVRNGS